MTSQPKSPNADLDRLDALQEDAAWPAQRVDEREPGK